MAEYRDEYGNPVVTDAYGNPALVTDEYGNPLRTDEHGNPYYDAEGNPIRSYSATPAATADAPHDPAAAHEKQLSRSGSSSSSSSSEDDGQGGRRKKKSLKEKIKEKLPGVHKHSSTHTDEHKAAGDGTSTAASEEHHEKKSLMEKIKDKLPGGHHNH